MARVYYPPENLTECQANTIPITQFSGWACQNGDAKLDALVSAGFLRVVDVPNIQVSKPGFVDEHHDVLTGKHTRKEIAAKYNLTVVEAPATPLTLSSPANNPFVAQPATNNQLPVVQAASPLSYPATSTSVDDKPADSMDLLEILNKRHVEASPVDVVVEKKSVKTYKIDDVRKMTDSEVADLATSHGILVEQRNTRRKQISDLVRLEVIEE